jgi:hypothetical protein
MNSTTITNVTNGAIVTVTTFHHSRHTLGLTLLAWLAAALIASGLYLLFRKQK